MKYNLLSRESTKGTGNDWHHQDFISVTGGQENPHREQQAHILHIRNAYEGTPPAERNQ